MSEKPAPEMYGRSRGESFEVVLLKKGVNSLDAKTEDFKRVGVVAGSPTEAMQDDAVTEAAGEDYVLVQAVNPAALTDYEMMARSRESQASMGGEYDKSKV
jgi:hypothetical protein